MVASGGVLSEGYGHGGPGVCLGDGQTEAEGVPSQGGRGDGVCPHDLPAMSRYDGTISVADPIQTASVMSGFQLGFNWELARPEGSANHARNWDRIDPGAGTH